MSRSIHRTRRNLVHEWRFDYADSERKTERIKGIYEQLGQKRSIKEQVQRERHKPKRSLPPVTPESIPIHVLDEGEYVHYPATQTDLLLVMQRLPLGMLDGLSAIKFCLGADRQSGANGSWESELQPDPFTGRYGYEDLPGIFGGKSRGAYASEQAEIRVFAFVYDPTIPDRQMWELYLRLDMLATFVHEVGHHYDFTRRVARGRWLASSGEKAEAYAKTTAYDLVLRHVVPYLESTYPESLKALDGWIGHYGGVSIPLSLLVRNPNIAIDDFFSPSHALEELASDVAKGAELTETRLGFARELHYAERYEYALAAIDRILDDQADHLEALSLKADIHGHMGEFNLAETLAQKVLTRDREFLEAWEVLANVYEARHEWGNLLAATTQILERLAAGDYWRRFPLAQRAKARLETGDLEGCEADMEELSQFKGSWVRRVLSKLEEEMQLRSTIQLPSTKDRGP